MGNVVLIRIKITFLEIIGKPFRLPENAKFLPRLEDENDKEMGSRREELAISWNVFLAFPVRLDQTTKA